MMKRILLCLIGFMMLQAVPAKRMRDYFADMPDSILYVMTRNNRLDCIDFIENNMQARVRNRFDAFSELKKMTDDSSNYERFLSGGNNNCVAWNRFNVFVNLPLKSKEICRLWKFINFNIL